MAMTVQEAYNILTKLHNYTGPETKRAISNFINARDIPIAVKNRGGLIGMQEGGDTPTEEDKEYTLEDVTKGQKKLVGDVSTDPTKAVKEPEVIKVDPDKTGTNIGEDEGDAGDATKAIADKVDTTATAKEPTATPVTKATTTTSAEQMKKLMDDVDPATGTVTKDVVGQTKTDTAISDLDAAQIDTPQTVKDAPTRTLGTGETITSTGVDQTKVGETFGTGEVKAASIQDELSTLMSQFDDGQTPPWAAGSMRKAMATLSARGLGASSMAGQAIIQAAMEAALPIAQIDTSNKQQMAMLKAEQRAKFLQMDFDQEFQRKVMNAAKVSEIANINFNADQQIALENAKMAQTVDLANLSNNQALVMAEAAQLSQLELTGLNNLQQAQVQNAQNFLQMDMANLSNKQQVAIFKGQQNANALLTDTAAKNATEQFNAKNANQSAQFDASLIAQVRQFNANQKNAIEQFNVGEANAIEQFNAAAQNAREQFNAQNSLIIAQANAKWRQDTTTLNTATENQANFEVAKQSNNLTNKQLDQIWQRERDIMSFSFTQSESALDRTLKVLLGDKTLEQFRIQADATEGAAQSELFARLFFGNKGLFGWG
jgi:hypothetical protein